MYGWLNTTHPMPAEIGRLGIEAAGELAWFEAHRRATIIILALQAYRLEHGQLPISLDALTGDYFEHIPLDPYSCMPYLYFPNGRPLPKTYADFDSIEDADYCTGLIIVLANPRYLVHRARYFSDLRTVRSPPTPGYRRKHSTA